MFNAKVMQGLSKTISQSLKPMATENKAQSAILEGLSKSLLRDTSGGGMNKALKEMSGSLLKITKMIEMQNNLLTEIKPDALEGGDDGGEAEKAKELEDAVKKITDENKKQAAEVEKLLSEIDKAAKEADGDKDAAKKIKTATVALEKAIKLIDEQSRLLDEARKALTG